MPAAADRLEFAPPPQPGTVPAFVLAILAHVLLMLALTWGITWNRESENMVAEAELWSSVPHQAAPAAATAPPVVQAPPLQTTPAPPPPPVAAKVEPAPPVPQPKPPDIALEQEKRKQEQAQRKQEELEHQKKIEARRKQDELERQKKLEARKKQEDLQKRELAERKAADEKKRQEEQVKAAKEEAKRVEAMRQENLRRMQGLAGATGRDDSKGTALRSSGPSDSYAGRIQARVRPHIVFTDDISGNPMATVEVQMAPDGTIVSRRLVKSSGVRSWDDAVLRALDKTEVLPRDVDGRIHTPLFIDFKPKG